MSKIKVADFYYGAVLSMLFSHGIKPALIENGDLKVNEKEAKHYSTSQIKTYVEALKNMIPGQFHFDGRYVFVDCSPDAVKQHIAKAISSDIPVNMRDMYTAMFKDL